MSSTNRSCFPILCPFMDMSTSKERKTASFLFGYSTSNAHEYKNNRINQVGSYGLFLMEKDLLQLPVQVRRRIAILICDTIKLFGTENRYVETTDEKNADSPQLNMRLDFWKSLIWQWKVMMLIFSNIFCVKVSPSSANSCFISTKTQNMILPLLTAEPSTLSRHLLTWRNNSLKTTLLDYSLKDTTFQSVTSCQFHWWSTHAARVVAITPLETWRQVNVWGVRLQTSVAFYFRQ